MHLDLQISFINFFLCLLKSAVKPFHWNVVFSAIFQHQKFYFLIQILSLFIFLFCSLIIFLGFTSFLFMFSFSILNMFITVVLKSITCASSGMISATLFCSFERWMFFQMPYFTEGTQTTRKTCPIQRNKIK